jgi:hypothetical protein
MIQMNMLWFCIGPWSDFAWYQLIGSLLTTLDWNHHEVILSSFVWHLETQSGPLTHILRNTHHLCVFGCNLLLKYLSTMSHMTFDIRQNTRLSFKTHWCKTYIILRVGEDSRGVHPHLIYVYTCENPLFNVWGGYLPSFVE